MQGLSTNNRAHMTPRERPHDITSKIKRCCLIGIICSLIDCITRFVKKIFCFCNQSSNLSFEKRGSSHNVAPHRVLGCKPNRTVELESRSRDELERLARFHQEQGINSMNARKPIEISDIASLGLDLERVIDTPWMSSKKLTVKEIISIVVDEINAQILDDGASRGEFERRIPRTDLTSTADIRRVSIDLMNDDDAEIEDPRKDTIKLFDKINNPRRVNPKTEPRNGIHKQNWSLLVDILQSLVDKGYLFSLSNIEDSRCLIVQA